MDGGYGGMRIERGDAVFCRSFGCREKDSQTAGASGGRS